MDRDDITVLDTKVVADHTVHAGRPIVKVVISKHDQDGVLAFLALDKHRVAAEELKSLHGVVGQSDDGVVVVHCICNTVRSKIISADSHGNATLMWNCRN